MENSDYNLKSRDVTKQNFPMANVYSSRDHCDGPLLLYTHSTTYYNSSYAAIM